MLIRHLIPGGSPAPFATNERITENYVSEFDVTELQEKLEKQVRKRFNKTSSRSKDA